MQKNFEILREGDEKTLIGIQRREATLSANPQMPTPKSIASFTRHKAMLLQRAGRKPCFARFKYK